jgi:ubiquinone biosynthesis protein UbiJ
MDLLDPPLSRALNHLLAGEAWARERLAPFVGETVEFRAPPLPALRVAIAPGGTTRPPDDGATPSLTLAVKPGALLALSRGVDHALREVDVTGNARLATEILFLARHLRWDLEEDLSRMFGDVVAHRMVGEGARLAAAAADAGRRVAAAMFDYAIDDRRLAVRRDEHEGLARESAQLRDAIERIEKRIERLS